tara:strand:+ start:135 stop:470 length:336 start_codon:yes stop_codon:yes gene_type:complete
MKRLLLPLLAALALPNAVEANWFGKYRSFREARLACSQWEWKKGIFSYIFTDSQGKVVSVDKPLRRCIDEEKTSQILGLEFVNIKDTFYSEKEWKSIENRHEEKVKKYFKY